MAEASNTSYHSDEEIDRILEELEQYPSAPEPVPEPEPEPAPSPAKPSWRRELWEWLRSLGIAAIAALLLFHYVIAFVSVKGRSMEPNVSEGDFLAVSGLFYTPKTGDIVVLSAKNGLKERLIKRVIATGGQTVDIVDGAVFIDGVKLEEPYLTGVSTGPGEQSYPLTVPEGQVFVMGDNRSRSTDSRYRTIGCVAEKEIVGRVLFRLLPLGRFGRIDR